MQRVNTSAIVLNRTNYGEADRIVTFLTPDHGKVSGLVKGVRKTRSKLAGGIELFSVSDISYIIGRGEVKTIVSTRLAKHYDHIVKDLGRTNAGYDFIKTLNKATEDHPEPAYFDLLKTTFECLDDQSINLNLVEAWFAAQLLKIAGHTPNLQTDIEGYKLEASKSYDFNFDSMSFQVSRAGRDAFDQNQIKFIRLIFGNNDPKSLNRLQGLQQLAQSCLPLLKSLLLNL